MRDYTAEYVAKLEEKLRIAEEALEFYSQGKHMNNIICGDESENYWHCDGDIENGYKAREALSKITETHNDKLIKSLKQAENGELVDVNIEDL